MKPPHQRIRALFPLWGSGSVRELPPHRDAGLEIVCVSRGRLRWRIEDRVYEPGPGYVFYTFPWELHGSIDEFEPGHRWDFVILTILGGRPSRRRTLPPAFGLAPAEGRHLLDRLMRSPHRSLPAGERLKWLLPELQKELAAPQGADLAIAATLGKAVLLELDRMVAQAASARPPSLDRHPDRCETLLRRLQSDYAETWNLKAMSQVMRLGRTRLGQLIKERTGDSPIVHLNRLRIGKAQELLRHTGQSITEIAFGCGFQSSQYFARTFKQLTGRTPGGYRAAYHRSNVMARNGSAVARLTILLALSILLGGLCPFFRAVGADDTLPNFNAPVDNSPLNVDKVNRAFGIEMFKEPSLWDEDAIFVAKRLGWPEESRTFSQSSYRLYPTEKNRSTFSARAPIRASSTRRTTSPRKSPLSL